MTLFLCVLGLMTIKVCGLWAVFRWDDRHMAKIVKAHKDYNDEFLKATMPRTRTTLGHSEAMKQIPEIIQDVLEQRKSASHVELIHQLLLEIHSAGWMFVHESGGAGQLPETEFVVIETAFPRLN